MTTGEQTPTVNLYATWNKSTPSHLINSSNNSNSNEKFCTESLLKQKMCSSKKYNHTSIPLDQPKFSSLQKPRVYTYDDRNLPNIFTSSSGSSTISFKDKTIKEVGETRYIQISFLISFSKFLLLLKILFNPRWM
jgi:hypothetical protein